MRTPRASLTLKAMTDREMTATYTPDLIEDSPRR
jgi:hypothetical protein